MKQTFTLYPSFSDFFSTNNTLSQVELQRGVKQCASRWVLKNVMAYSAALFVARTKNYGSYSLLLN